MASLIAYPTSNDFVQIVSPDPTGAGGLAIHDNFKAIADIVRKPTAGSDSGHVVIENTTGGNEVRIRANSVNTIVTDVDRSYLYRIAGSDPINNTTGLDSKKLAFESRLWDGAAAQSRFGNIRFEDVSGVNDQGQFTLSSTDNGGTENDFLSIRRDSVADVLFSVPSGADMRFLRPGLTQTVILIGSTGAWELLTSSGSRMLRSGNTFMEAQVNLRMLDNTQLSLGNGDDVRFEWDTNQTSDALLWGFDSGGSNTVIITHVDQLGTNFGFSAETVPTIKLHDGSSTTTNVTSLRTNGTVFEIDPAGSMHITEELKVGGDNTLTSNRGLLVLGTDVNFATVRVTGITIRGQIELTRSNGTEASQTAILATEDLGQVSFRGHDGSTPGMGASIRARASVNFSGTDYGTDIEFRNVADGTTSLSTNLTIRDDGVINIPNLGATMDVQTDASSNLITVSDARAKDLHGPIGYGLDEILGLKPVFFNFKHDPADSRPNMGFTAQNVQEFIPEAVGEAGNGQLGLNSRGILATLVNAIKELNEKIRKLESN